MTDTEKVRVVKIERPESLGIYYTLHPEPAIEELKVHMEYGEVGDELRFTIQEMTLEEYESLPAFTGW